MKQRHRLQRLAPGKIFLVADAGGVRGGPPRARRTRGPLAAERRPRPASPGARWACSKQGPDAGVVKPGSRFYGAVVELGGEILVIDIRDLGEIEEEVRELGGDVVVE